MFILKTRGVDGDEYVIGYSEDRAQLDFIVAQYNAVTMNPNTGEKMAFNEAPETIGFGKLVLTKNLDNFCYKLSSDSSKVIGYYNYLYIEEIKPI